MVAIEEIKIVINGKIATFDDLFELSRILKLGVKTCYAKIVNGVMYYTTKWRI